MSVAAERMTGEGRRRAIGWLAVVSTLAAATLARAEEKPAAPSEADDLSLKRLELRGVEDVIGESAANRKRLQEEMSAHAAVRENLTRTLLDATARLQETEARAAETEARLGVLAADEKKITQSLDDRRALIVEVLMVLQRMGRRPPPALLARPQDILEALRAALALGDLLPQMRAEVQSLQRDLAELVRLREATRDEQARLTKEKTALAEQRDRLNELIASRRRAMAEAETALQAESERIEKLARQATSLKDLISRMEAESEAARKGAAAARKADEDRAAAQARLDAAAREKALAAPFRDPARLAPAVSFADLKGKLNFPASGEILRRYGAPDGFGGKEKAWFIATRDNGVVVAPCDGWIAFSGPYRTFGQLLIINAGDGYYVVLAGMSRSNVNVGQFVLAGEPVASMGDGAAQTSSAIAIGAKKPILYVEFRKDGASIDSSPWWAKSDSRKVGG
ncbi:murein hydrolase activator EnvC family protein [Methylocystis echinoides]|uniref:Membrane protein n=1 Tax=Methylocystis echinoides TaxID=29468 RepID=A0A9W6GR46_9HYPH|nr:peptidoglycan DD-metalloendopeptidase family protein [Methylocystis echinoides]GLI91375.1 membrane protein [Methylocystis echinoides]